MKKYYSLEERIAYYRQRIKSLEAKLASEKREERSSERLADMCARIDETHKMLAELIEELRYRTKRED